ncbi:phosphonate ABC transporter, permease protein PhnE [Notoacmeibacter sp. MSK16QG-6]|uniref:phosphonate ABC transporter, permease protein PhnE n=1 Tax=Notoacmeibacter sp. MSK16QG-6 TaxID=2957982 RepID=UPI00209D1BB2|nr:phosphonate ABC transporter, permease protein PhnE [Notoacmeibacter sp. MSK16QG-6]MCP1201130.1 phosphonate ABC transporter, permease protein PhnE [Notoacmeibacter sp. MSK16QG-6]
MTAIDYDAISERHEELLQANKWKRFAPLIMLVAIVFYSVYCWWFFAVGETLRRVDLSIAENYLADWISYEARPDFDIETDGAMQIVFPRFSPLGKDPKPDWIVIERGTMEREIGGGSQNSSAGSSAGSGLPATGFTGEGDQIGTTSQKRPATGFMGEGAQLGTTSGGGSETGEEAPTTETVNVVRSAQVSFGNAGEIDVTPKRVTVKRGGESVVLVIDVDRSVRPQSPLPDWAAQKYEDGKVTVRFGFDGRAEIEDDAVKIRRRFFGWENFLFDINSPYFGMSTGEVLNTIVRGERLDPSRSNLSLAWNNILYNASWQHLDVWIKLLQTIVMAFVGTLFASIVAFPLAFLAARNITRNRFANHLTKRFFDFQRSVDMFIWALFFTRAFGPGPLAGISAIFFTDTGTLGKLYSESLENIDGRQREGVRSVGATPTLVQRFGVLPQVLPVFASHALYFWESNTRSATIIGAVGAGGIGLKLWEAMRTNQDWENVAYMVLLILITVYVFDRISTALRVRLMRQN